MHRLSVDKVILLPSKISTSPPPQTVEALIFITNSIFLLPPLTQFLKELGIFVLQGQSSPYNKLTPADSLNEDRNTYGVLAP